MSEHPPPCMLTEIREQGELLERCWPRWADAVDQIVSGHRAERMHLVGCGDMYFAAALIEALAPFLFQARTSAWRSMDLRWVRTRLAADDLVVCASISGRTLRTVEAALLARQRGARVIGVTDNPGSPLDEALEETLILGTAPVEELDDDAYAGYRHVIAQTQTYLAVLGVELLLAAAHAGGRWDLARIGQTVGKAVTVLDAAARGIAAEFFSGGQEIVVLGSGPHLPVARYGAAKYLEFALPAIAQCIEEYNHLGSFVAGETTRIVVLAGDPEAADRAADVSAAWEEVGARSLVVAVGGAFPGRQTRVLRIPGGDLLDVILAEVVALQLLAVGGVSIMGRDPDRWLGGRRTDQVQAMSKRTIRGSGIWRPDR